MIFNDMLPFWKPPTFSAIAAKGQQKKKIKQLSTPRHIQPLLCNEADTLIQLNIEVNSLKMLQISLVNIQSELYLHFLNR